MKTVIENYFLTLCKATAVTLMMAFAFASCKKEKMEEPVKPTVALEGKWMGKYGGIATPPGRTYAMEIQADGGLIVYDGDFTSTIQGEGNWARTGNQFSASYTYLNGGTFSITATINGAKLENGTWGHGTVTSGGGTWFMTKQ